MVFIIIAVVVVVVVFDVVVVIIIIDDQHSTQPNTMYSFSLYYSELTGSFLYTLVVLNAEYYARKYKLRYMHICM